MKVLIVNGYSQDNPESKRQFQCFVEGIIDAFAKYKYMCVGAPEFIIRTKVDVDQYLYEPNSKYGSDEAIKLFDHLDFVFVDGDSNLLPWLKAAEKFTILFLMCKKTNKCLFISGFGMQMLAYYCATYFEPISVINGNGKGGPLSDIKLISPFDPLGKRLSQSKVFLDNTTGDIYTFQYETNEWVPKGNVGLHNVRSAQAHGQKGFTIIKTKTYRPNRHKEIMEPVTAKLTQVRCRIVKQYIQHWALKGIPNEFVACNKNSWDPHPVNLTKAEVGSKPIILVESDRGPQISTHQNTLACQFHLDKHYKETLMIIDNFVHHVLTMIQEQGKVDITLEEAEKQRRQKVYKENNLNFFKLNSPHRVLSSTYSSQNLLSKKEVQQVYGAEPKIITQSKSHSNLLKAKLQSPMISLTQYPPSRTSRIQPSNCSSPYGGQLLDPKALKFSKNLPSRLRLVQNNALRSGFRVPLEKNSLKNTNREKSSGKLTGRVPSSLASMSKKSINKLVLPTLRDSSQDTKREQNEQSHQSPQAHFQFISHRDQQFPTSAAVSPKNSQIMMMDFRSSMKPREIDKTKKGFSLRKLSLPLNMSSNREIQSKVIFQNQVYLKSSYLNKRHHRTGNQGSKSENSFILISLIVIFLMALSWQRVKQTQITGFKELNEMRDTNRKKKKLIISSNPYTRYREFQKKPVYNLDIPCIRNSGTYQSEKERESIQLKKNKERWVGGKDFQTIFKAKESYIDNYVSKDPSKPPVLHQFRDVNKEKWIDHNFIF